MAELVSAGERHAESVAQGDLPASAQPLLLIRDNGPGHLLHVRDRIPQAVRTGRRTIASNLQYIRSSCVTGHSVCRTDQTT